MPLLSESPTVLPIHRKILAFSFIGWIFDFYDLLLLSFLVSSTTLTKDLALGRRPSFTAFSVMKAVGLGMVTLGWELAGGYTPTVFAFMFLVCMGEGDWGCIARR